MNAHYAYRLVFSPTEVGSFFLPLPWRVLQAGWLQAACLSCPFFHLAVRVLLPHSGFTTSVFFLYFYVCEFLAVCMSVHHIIHAGPQRDQKRASDPLGLE